MRLANQAKDKWVNGAKWPYLEYTTNLVFTTGTRQYTLGTDVGHVVSIITSAGQPLEPVHRATYDQVFHPDTATAVAPTAFAVRQFTTQAQPTVHVWKTPAAIGTGTLHYIRRITDMTNAGSANGFDHIPSEHYAGIIEFAEAMFHEWEDSPQAPALNQKANMTLAMMAQRCGAPLAIDATRK